MRPGHRVALLLLAGGLAACASKRAPEEPPTLKTLAGRAIVVEADAGVEASEAQTISAYRKFLDVAPNAPQRAEAMRRLGDLEMDSADSAFAAGQAANPDYRAAVARYHEYLKAYPDDPGNDRVLYQLARAQELTGDLETALKTLDQLVARYPQTDYADEAHFRRGELLFATREYAKAEASYATVLASGSDNVYHERALYMQGWSQFKQGKLESALHAFFGVLDLKLGSTDEETASADRELLDDTFRVASLSLASLQGAESIPAYVTSDVRRSYQHRVYEQLGELYVKQDRTKDAADAFAAFARVEPLHAEAPVLQARVIEIYRKNGFATLALDAKRDYVSRYGAGSEFRKVNPQGWERAQPLVKTHLAELARHFHASAQKTKASSDYQEAIRWYRAYIASFPSDPDAAQSNFLLAELLFEEQRFGEAAVEYEKAAYGYPAHAKSADAGYAALLAFAQHEKRAAPADARAVQAAGVESALRFATGFPTDRRAGGVLTNAAEKLYALGDGERAAKVAAQVLKLDPPATSAERRVAWTVVAHTAFERGAFGEAERAYGEVLAFVPDKDAARGGLVERLAASIYKQGEQARAAGNARDAVDHFARVASVAPQSAVRATAQYDAAAALIGLKDWAGAARTLEDFRRRFPSHALSGDIDSRLALAYLEQKEWSRAAGEFERIAASNRDAQVARDALWQAAELHEKANARNAAAKTYERYVKQYPEPLPPALEARFRLAGIAKADGNAARELQLMREILQANQRGGSARTDRTRALGATAALALAEPALDAYRKVALVEPLARQLKLKKARMEEVLKAYAVAADYGAAEVTTAATFHTAAVYHDFGKAMLASERPRKLSKAEREQYDVLLEEQAFPFEEKAIELHETNARRAADGVYDKWVKESFTALGVLRPVRYAKTERSEGVIDAIR